MKVKIGAKSAIEICQRRLISAVRRRPQSPPGVDRRQLLAGCRGGGRRSLPSGVRPTSLLLERRSRRPQTVLVGAGQDGQPPVGIRRRAFLWVMAKKGARTICFADESFCAGRPIWRR